jgi:hypothetical protein
VLPYVRGRIVDHRRLTSERFVPQVCLYPTITSMLERYSNEMITRLQSLY